MKKKIEKCCGNCCWFIYEDPEGDGMCMVTGGEGLPYGRMFNCGCKSCKKFVSRQEMRHHMAVMLQYTRWIQDENFARYSVSGDELDKAVEFAYKHIKIFSQL